MTESPKARVYRNGRGQIIGAVLGDTLRKTVHGSRHMMRSPAGWAWDKAIVDLAERAGAVWAEITDAEDGCVYRAALAEFWRHGIKRNYGHGLQTILPLDYWQRRRPWDVTQLELFSGSGVTDEK